MVVGIAGWVFVFRSGVGLALAALGLPLLHLRIAAEEALLATQFGDAWERYRARTWRLAPGVY